MSTATATPPRATKRYKRTAPIDPATVAYDDLRSTKFHALYRVPSVSEPGSYRRVTMDEATGEWGCSCTAASFGATDCRHVCAARQARRLAWWRNAYRGVDDLTLRRQDRLYAAMCAEGTLGEDDQAGWETCGDLIAERWLAAEGVTA